MPPPTKIGAFLLPTSGTHFNTDVATMQDTFVLSWIPSFDISYSMGIDGISLPLILLTTLICLLAMAASWSVTKYVKAYCILFLILETAMLGGQPHQSQLESALYIEEGQVLDLVCE